MSRASMGPLMGRLRRPVLGSVYVAPRVSRLDCTFLTALMCPAAQLHNPPPTCPALPLPQHPQGVLTCRHSHLRSLEHPGLSTSRFTYHHRHLACVCGVARRTVNRTYRLSPASRCLHTQPPFSAHTDALRCSIAEQVKSPENPLHFLPFHTPSPEKV